MTTTILKLLFFSLLLGILACTTSEEKVIYPDELKQLHTNLIEVLMDEPIPVDEVDELLSTMNEDGSWSGIPYESKERGGWKAMTHFENLRTIAQAYKTDSLKYYNDKAVAAKVHRALNYWLDNDFLSGNWWYQHIGVPEALMPVLFLIENELTDKQLKKSLPILRRAHIKMSGQNKVWLSANVMMRSLLTRKSDSVGIASKSVQEELKIVSGVGIKSDWSYHEHGPQLQFGNYGLSYLEDMVKWFTVLSNTPYAFEETKLEVLRNYLLQGQQWVAWKERYDISASGRQLFPNQQHKKFLTLKRVAKKMALLDTEYADAYLKIVNQSGFSGDKHFWKSDFHVHRSKDYYFSVRMSSKRVYGTESVNKENLRGYHTGDGVCFLYQHPDDYYNIYPFWNWRRLPGSTIIQNTEPLPVIKGFDFVTHGEFVGGVTDAKNGIAAMNYNRDGLIANKAWFMFGNTIVCVGSGINAKTENPVTTSVEQSFLKDGYIISEAGEKKMEQGNAAFEADWVMHNNKGYLFPKRGKIKIFTKMHEARWSDITKRYREEIYTGRTFSLWFDHGANPIDATYNYIMVPNATAQKMEELQNAQPFDIVNSKNQQIVVAKDGSLGGVVFYKAGKAALFGGVEVSEACIVMLTKDGDNLVLVLSEPTQKLKQLKLTINGSYTAANSINKGATTVLNIDLPTGEEAGKTVLLNLKKQ